MIVDRPKLSCTDPLSICEKPQGLQVAGVCDVGSGECICPDGWSGRDEFDTYNACVIHEPAQTAMWAITLSFAAITFITSLYSFSFFLKKYRKVLNDLKAARMRRASTKSNATGSGTDERSTGFTVDFKKKIEKLLGVRMRQKWALSAVSLSLVYCIGVFIYVGGLLAGVTRADREIFLDIGLFMAFSAIIISLWQAIMIYHDGLGKLKVFAKLFNVDSILIRKPYMVRTLSYVRIIGVPIVSLFLVVILPYGIDDSDRMKEIADTIFLVWIVIAVGDYLFVSIILSFLQWKLYGTLDSLSREAEENGTIPRDSSRGFTKALNTIKVQTAIALLVGPFIVIISLACAFVWHVRVRLFISFGLILIGSNLSVLAMVVTLTWRMSRSKRKQKTRVKGRTQISEVDSMASSSAKGDSKEQFVALDDTK